MINALLHFVPGAFDFGLQRSDARAQFLDGQGIEILLLEQPYRIIGPSGQIVVQVHDANC